MKRELAKLKEAVESGSAQEAMLARKHQAEIEYKELNRGLRDGVVARNVKGPAPPTTPKGKGGKGPAPRKKP